MPSDMEIVVNRKAGGGTVLQGPAGHLSQNGYPPVEPVKSARKGVLCACFLDHVRSSTAGRTQTVCFPSVLGQSRTLGEGSPARPNQNYRVPAPEGVPLENFSHVRSCRHIVRNSSQKPVTANHAIAMPTVTMSGWLKLVRLA